jgi:hypothetical protein
MSEKFYPDAGAAQSTPSIPQYFSWINNTNEGSTEKQTLINLDFFAYMKEKFGMQIRIYAWDAGNFDGASEGYGDLKGEKFRSQYPNGYKKIVDRAKELGIRMGLWGSPDGYGDTPQEEKERFDFFVHLCRDYNFAEFKLDGVCGTLRPEKASVFAEMLKECRKYSPDLIVLNHRLEFYEAQKYITTFLWNGEETYTDVHAHNRITAMHNRAYTFTRGNVDGLNRLAEDHGVCLSSSLDYFEDELIYQAFGRNLILSPQIYGNPWFLKDCELPRLARIYNLHRQTADILVNGIALPEEMGANAVSRGNKDTRFICTGNGSWESREISIRLDESIGLDNSGEYAVILRHPYEQYLGVFAAGTVINTKLLPFRAALIEISRPQLALPVVTNCEYNVITEDENGIPKEIKIIKTEGGKLELLYEEKTSPFMTSEKVDIKEKPPVYLGKLDMIISDPEDGEKLYDIAAFAADNDSLEARCIKRSGESDIPEVRSARDAFFGQETYRLRGCEARNMFDGRPDTFFDGRSRSYWGSFRSNGGCLRVDFGRYYNADLVTVTCFAPDTPTFEAPQQIIPVNCAYSSSCDNFIYSSLQQTQIIDNDYTETIVRDKVHTLYTLKGKLIRISYLVPGGLRYLKIDKPMDRIYDISLYNGDERIAYDTAPRATNLFAPSSSFKVRVEKRGSIVLPEVTDPGYIAVALNGRHGDEGAFCVAEIDGQLCGFPRRAPDFKANVWEHIVCSEDSNYTYYLDIPAEWSHKTLTVRVVFANKSGAAVDCKVWFCPKHD